MLEEGKNLKKLQLNIFRVDQYKKLKYEEERNREREPPNLPRREKIPSTQKSTISRVQR